MKNLILQPCIGAGNGHFWKEVEGGGGRGLTNMGLGIWFQEETYYPELMHGFARQTSRMKSVVVRRLYAKLFL